MKIIDNYKNIDKKKWKDFVADHPDGNIFQTPEMYDVYQGTINYDPIIIAAVNENDDIQGILLAVVQKEKYDALGWFTARSIIFN